MTCVRVAASLDQVLALQRWQLLARSGSLALPIRADSQDTWLFLSPLQLPPSLSPRRFDDLTLPRASDGSSDALVAAAHPLGFQVGRPQCDNHLAALLVEAGLRVRNPALDVVTVHVQRTGGGGHSAQHAVPGSSALVPLAESLWYDAPRNP